MEQRPRVVYDGICNLCTTTVRFLHALRGENLVQYVPFQNLTHVLRQRYGLTGRELQGQMYLIRGDGSVASGPFAITEICRLLTPFSFLCNLFKTTIAQRSYALIAERRYRIFGCRESCYTIKSHG